MAGRREPPFPQLDGMVVSLITVSRFFVMIPAVLLLADGATSSLVWAYVLFLLMELTDVTDGVIARRDGTVSDVGKLLDPLMDSVCRFTIFATFQWMKLMPLWMLLVLFYRDIVVAYMRSMAASRGVVVAARTSGKIKAIIQAAGIQLVMMLLVAQALASGDDPSLPAFWSPVVAATILTLAYLYLLRLWERILWLLGIVAVAATAILWALWAWRPQFDTVEWSFWILGAVTLGTAWSLFDYTRGLIEIIRTVDKNRDAPRNADARGL